MDWLTDEMLLYGGAAAVGGSLLLSFLYFCFSQITKTRLRARLGTEYGERKKELGKRRGKKK